MPTTLVTGANGFVAAHVIKGLIDKGHTVVGSVRSAKKGEQILAVHPEWADKLSFTIVSDYTKAGTWDETFKNHDFDYVVHVAAPLLDNPENVDFDKFFLEPSVKGNSELLESASKYGENVKHISVTGSINALTMGMSEEIKDHVFKTDEYNNITLEYARKVNNAYVSYCAGKKFGELAIWEYMKKNKPTYSVSVMLPCLIFGPPIQYIDNLKHINYSCGQFYSLWNGTYKEIPPTSFPSYIDVRDLADAHIKALTTPAAANKRFLIGGAQRFTHTMAIHIAEQIPEIAKRVPKDSGEEPLVFQADTAETDRILGMKYRTKEETFLDMAKRILELEKQLNN